MLMSPWGLGGAKDHRQYVIGGYKRSLFGMLSSYASNPVSRGSPGRDKARAAAAKARIKKRRAKRRAKR